MKALPLLLCILAVLAGPARAQDDEVNGAVTRLQGNAVAMQDAIPRPLKVGDTILNGDVISTAKGARLEMRMIDDGVIALGEGTGVRSANVAPSPPKAWPKTKIDRAVATVTFR